MTERRNIDRLFQEKFKDFEAIPKEKIWENIEAELKKKKKRRVIPFWLKLTGIAAALLIGLLLMDRFVLSGEEPNNKIVEENKTGTQKPGIQNNQIAYPEKVTVESGTKDNKSVPQNFPDTNPDNGPAITATGSQSHKSMTVEPGQKINPDPAVAVSDDQKENRVNKGSQQGNNRSSAEKTQGFERVSNKNSVANNKKRNFRTQHQTTKGIVPEKNPLEHPADTNGIAANAVENNKTLDNSRIGNDNKSMAVPEEKPLEKNTDHNSIAENTLNKKDTVATAAVPNALEELLNEKENKVTAKEPKLNRWQISSNIAPIYFSSTSNGSPLDSRFESNKKSYATSLSYGAGVKYALNKKLSFKSGINAVALEYNTNDVIFFQTANARRIENVTANIQGTLIEVDNKPAGAAPADFGRTVKQYSGNLNQKTGYVEIPVEVSYKLVDRKFGIELIGGLSTLFLNQNEITIMSPGLHMNIGEANNLNSIHFSTNLGMGFKYSFLKSFQANLEPMFKYQINTYNSDPGNFKPYFFGLYTGLSYRF